MIFDKMDKMVFPAALLNDMIAECGEVPLIYRPPLIADATSYVQERKDAIAKALIANPTDAYSHVDKSDEYLATLPDGVENFAILSLDVVGSTKLANSVDTATFSKIMSTISYELAKVASEFHGHILKFTGDGILAFIPPPGFTCANDLIIDCALTMQSLIYDAINPALMERGHPTVDVRIGIESGEAINLTIGHPNTKRHKDLLGQTLNLACKIQSTAEPGEIRVGCVAYRNMHTQWKQSCIQTELPKSWAYALRDGEPYPIYKYVSGHTVFPLDTPTAS